MKASCVLLLAMVIFSASYVDAASPSLPYKLIRGVACTFCSFIPAVKTFCTKCPKMLPTPTNFNWANCDRPLCNICCSYLSSNSLPGKCNAANTTCSCGEVTYENMLIIVDDK